MLGAWPPAVVCRSSVRGPPPPRCPAACSFRTWRTQAFSQRSTRRQSSAASPRTWLLHATHIEFDCLTCRMSLIIRGEFSCRISTCQSSKASTFRHFCCTGSMRSVPFPHRVFRFRKISLFDMGLARPMSKIRLSITRCSHCMLCSCDPCLNCMNAAQLNMATVLVTMGGFGTYLGWAIRSDPKSAGKLAIAGEPTWYNLGKTTAKLHSTLMGAMAIIFFLGANGGLVLSLVQVSPRFLTCFPRGVQSLQRVMLIRVSLFRTSPSCSRPTSPRRLLASLSWPRKLASPRSSRERLGACWLPPSFPPPYIQRCPAPHLDSFSHTHGTHGSISLPPLHSSSLLPFLLPPNHPCL